MFEKLDFEIECPNCDAVIPVLAEQVGKSVVCPNCKETISLIDNGFQKKLKDAENDLNKALDDFN